MRGDVDLCIVLGGDGTILRALRLYAGTERAGVRGQLRARSASSPRWTRTRPSAGSARAFAGDFDVARRCPRSQVAGRDDGTAINDISLHRQPDGRVAELAYAVGDDEIGRVRCDGLVISTPAGSTGYNLANGGPVLAWGVEGYVVSFIAPHSLTARALVVAPDDRLTSQRRRAGPGRRAHRRRADMRARRGRRDRDRGSSRASGRLAQIPGTNFYHRLREKFGRLAS